MLDPRPTPRRVAWLLLGLAACAAPAPEVRPRRVREGGRHPETRDRDLRAEARRRAREVPAVLPVDLRGADLLALPVREVAGSPELTLQDAWFDPRVGRVQGLTFSDVAGPAWLEFASLRLVAGEDGPRLEPAAPPEGEPRPAPQLDLGALFEGYPASELEGEVIAGEVVGEGLGQQWIVRLRDEENLLHRVLLPNPGLVRRGLPRLREGERATFRARPTRDQRGRLWVAESARAGGRTLQLRDARGELLWGDLRGDLRSARALAGSTVTDPEGRTMEVVDFVFDRAGARVRGLLVVRGGVERLVPWERLGPAPGGGWSCDVDPEELGPFEPGPDEVVGTLDPDGGDRR